MFKAAHVFFLLSLIVSMQANSEVYQYHPNSRFYLGGGFNPFKPNQGAIRCIVHDGVDQVDTASDGAVHTEAIIKMVNSRKELYESVGFSASIGGGFLFFSGEGSVQLENESAFQSDSLSWLLLFKSDYGRSVLRNPRLEPALSGMPEDQLYERCGSEVVTEVRKGVMAYALFTVNNLSERQKTVLNTKFKASFNNGLWNASAQADFQSFMSSVAAMSNVSIKVNAIGGQGITNLVSLLDESGSPDFFAKYNRAPVILANYIRGMDHSRSVPIQFTTMHIKSFVPTLGGQFVDFRTRQVAELFNWHQDISANVARLRNILFGDNRNEYLLTKNEIDSLRANVDQYIAAMNSIYDAANFCFIPAEVYRCQLPSNALSLSPINWPRRKDDDKCHQLREFAWSSGLIENIEEYKFAVKRNFAPRLVFSNDGKASINGWHRCEELLSNDF